MIALWGALLSAAVAASPAAKVKVLVMPLAAGEGVGKDLTRQLTVAFVGEAAKLPGYDIVSLDDVQGAFDSERLKQVVECQSLSCAVDLAGAVNSEQVVVGTLGRLGDALQVALQRISAREAVVLGRVTERYRGDDVNVVVDALPGLVRKLFGVLDQPAVMPTAGKPVVPPPTAMAPAQPATEKVDADAPNQRTSSLSLKLPVAAGGALASLSSLPGFFAAAVLAAGYGGVAAYDAAMTGGWEGGRHKIDATTALLAQGALLASLLVPIPAVVVMLGGLVVFAVAWVLP